jgi:hypothetical protein
VREYIPELGGMGGLSARFGTDLQDQFKQFRFGDDALQPGAASGFANELLQTQQIQDLLQRQELAGEGSYLGRQSGVEGRGLSDVVEELLGQSGSQLSGLYGQTGFDTGQISEDIRRFASGEESGLGHLSAHSLSGDIRTADLDFHTQGSREAVLQSILGDQLVDIGGRTFNPFSQDILGDSYNFGLGGGGGIGGSDLLSLSAGILGTQQSDITSGVQQGLRRAYETGASSGFGGETGYRVGHALAGIGGQQLGEGQFVSQSNPQIGNLIATWFGGRMGGGHGRGFAQNFASSIQNRPSDRLAL